MAGIHAAIAGAGAPSGVVEIGEVFAVWDNVASAPSISGEKYVKLTAGQSYNSGLLTNETVSGSFPTVSATAQIAVGPLAGQTIRLLNTERDFVRGGSSGTLEQDTLQGHRHSASYNGHSGSDVGRGGSGITVSRNDIWAVSINAANSGRRGTETRAKNVGTTFYMRVK